MGCYPTYGQQQLSSRPVTKDLLRGALSSLLRLSHLGFTHRDARWPNVLWHGDSPVWIDFRTMEQRPDVTFDVGKLLSSVGVDTRSNAEDIDWLLGLGNVLRLAALWRPSANR